MADQWTGGSGGSDLSAVFASQTELARQMATLAQQVGTVIAKIDDRVTHKELMETVDKGRKEQTDNFQHMENKFDGAVKDVKSALTDTVGHIKENLGGIITTEVSKAMTARDQLEQKASAVVQTRNEDIDRRVRDANLRAIIGVVAGLFGVGVTIWQAFGGGG